MSVGCCAKRLEEEGIEFVEGQCEFDANAKIEEEFDAEGDAQFCVALEKDSRSLVLYGNRISVPQNPS